MRARDELRMQATIVAWLRNRGYHPVHMANEYIRSAKQGAIAKREGMEPGVPDLLIFEVPMGREEDFAGVAMELKTKTGKVSKKQKQWIARLEQNRWIATVIRSKEEAVVLLTELGYDRVS